LQPGLHRELVRVEDPTRQLRVARMQDLGTWSSGTSSARAAR
jgi:hypothetical protein